MALDSEQLAEEMKGLFKDIVIDEKVRSLGNLKKALNEKKQYIEAFINTIKQIEKGKYTQQLLDELVTIKNDFNELYNNFDDKLMIFIIGNGNVGKSTLLNALIGSEAAETNFLPNTWKIDVYSPSVPTDKAIIKYSDGRQKSLTFVEAKRIISEEEMKTKKSKQEFNAHMNSECRTIKTKEERDEMCRYLEEKYLYRSKISEVQWGTQGNWLLDKCLLVDTPGLNQKLYKGNQSVGNYYHKADAVLWLLDGQVIAAANTKNLFDELREELTVVGGIRDNIIGVINRMDLVEKNGGKEAVAKVEKDAKTKFNKNFLSLIGVSAKKAFEGITKKDEVLIKESGIYDLQEAIRKLFLSKSEAIKNSAKEQGHNRLQSKAMHCLKDFTRKVDENAQAYDEKQKKVKKLSEEIKSSINTTFETYFENYLSEVRARVDRHIDALSEGEGAEYIKSTMYQLDKFKSDRSAWIRSQELELKNAGEMWERICIISEYKYIKNVEQPLKKKINIDIENYMQELEDIAFFSPSYNTDLFSIAGNLLGKGMFWLRKGSIKGTIMSVITRNCNDMRQSIEEQFSTIIDQQYAQCMKILDEGFSRILFDNSRVDAIKKEVEELEKLMTIETKEVQLKDILF